MTDSRWQRVKSLFQSAAALPPEARAALLDRECRGDGALRREVESLLAAHRPTGGGEPALPIGGEGPGSRVGPYRILAEIGEGGFGTVFLAEQETPVRRRVALKVIKAGMDTRQVVARFEQERQALALMDHPCIARVLDGGATESGRPYFVMELVRGDPITAYCDRERLSMRERLELFAQVCRAVQHAHQKGVIHRDIKPANVLVTIVDGEPVPKVIDFGVAKATQGRLTDRTLFTEHRQMIGTPLYMSPEQAQLSGVDVDTRSDVYSLGVLLYELLTGVPPFDQAELLQAGIAEMHRMIRELEPKKPSTRIATLGPATTAVAAQRKVEPGKLGTLLRGDLDWIVMRCLEKERARRYATTEDLARDVGAYLTGEPVQAAPPSRMYRLHKLVRRHRGAFAAAGAIMFVTLVGLSGMLWQHERAVRAQKERAELQQTLAEQQTKLRNEAEAQRDAAQLAQSEAEWNGYIANIGAAYAAHMAGDAATMRSRLEACPEHLRNWEWRYLHSESGGAVASLPSLGIEYDPEWERDVTSHWDGQTADWNPDHPTSKDMREAVGGEPIVCSTRLADGTRVATFLQDAGVSHIRIADVHMGLATPIADLAITDCQCSWKEERVPLGGFSPDGQWLIALCLSGEHTDVWRTDTWARTCSIQNAGTWSFSEDGRLLLCNPHRYDPEVFDPSNGALLYRLQGHRGWVNACRFSADSMRIATACQDGATRVWDAEEGTLLATLNSNIVPAYDVTFLADNDSLVTAADDGLHTWSIEKRAQTETEWRLAFKASYWATRQIASSPDGAWLVGHSYDSTLSIWHVPTGTLAATLYDPQWFAHRPVFSPDGRYLVAMSPDGARKIWHASSWQRAVDSLQSETTEDVMGRSSHKLHWSGSWWDDSTIVVDYDLYDATTHKSMGSILGPNGLAGFQQRAFPYNVMARSRDSHLEVIPTDSSLVVWDNRHAEALLRVPTSDHDTEQVSLGGGRLAALFRGGEVQLWNIDTRTDVVLTRDPNLKGISLSPDGERLLLVGLEAQVVNTHDGASISNLSECKEILPDMGYAMLRHEMILWSPDGTRILAMQNPQTLGLWDVRTGARLATFKGHAERILSIDFSPDGSRILTTEDPRGTLTLYDGFNGTEVLSLLIHERSINSARFSPDGSRILSLSQDGTWRILNSMPPTVREREFCAMDAALQKMRPWVSSLRQSGGRSPWDVIASTSYLTEHESRAAAIVLNEEEAMSDRERQASCVRAVRRLLSGSTSTEEAEVALELIEGQADARPEDETLILARGLALYRLGRCEEALVALQEEGGSNDDIRRALGVMALSRLGRRESAREELGWLRKRSFAFRPDQELVQRKLIQEAEAVFAVCFPEQN